ncbi:MAG: nuclear transport factor 2 family protein [Solirubrobacteraceae bacterium]|nr:nuclear transport factor 2 family protein [Solirubrobacteraceae bacterium]
MPDRVEQLWAIHEIQQLAYRYAYAFDSRDLEMLHALWDRDAPVLPYPDITYTTVREDFDQWLYGLGVSVLNVGNHIIEIDDADHAHGTVYCRVEMELEGEFVDQSILYQDRYVRRDDRWLFHVRRHLLWYGAPRPANPLELPDANWPASPVGRGTLPGDLESFQAFQRIKAARGNSTN